MPKFNTGGAKEAVDVGRRNSRIMRKKTSWSSVENKSLTLLIKTMLEAHPLSCLPTEPKNHRSRASVEDLIHVERLK